MARLRRAPRRPDRRATSTSSRPICATGSTRSRHPGLAADEAFLVAVKRLGGSTTSRASSPASTPTGSGSSSCSTTRPRSSDADAASGPIPFLRRANGLAVALALGVGAGIAVHGRPSSLTGDPDVVFRNIAVLVLPFLAAFFSCADGRRLGTLVGVAAPFAVAALALNLYPFAEDRRRSTSRRRTPRPRARDDRRRRAVARDRHRLRRRRLADRPRPHGLHPLHRRVVRLLRAHRARRRRADRPHIGVFARSAWTSMPFVEEWVLPCGVAGAVVVAGLARRGEAERHREHRPRAHEGLHPAVHAAAARAHRRGRRAVEPRRRPSRDLLIMFDLVLVVVLALLLYSLSARDPRCPAGLVRPAAGARWSSAALVVDVHRARRDDRPHRRVRVRARTRLASLGLNLILLANLAWAAWLQFGFVRRRVPFATLERWQTGFLRSTSAGLRSSFSSSRRCSASCDLGFAVTAARRGGGV